MTARSAIKEDPRSSLPTAAGTETAIGECVSYHQVNWIGYWVDFPGEKWCQGLYYCYVILYKLQLLAHNRELQITLHHMKTAGAEPPWSMPGTGRNLSNDLGKQMSNNQGKQKVLIYFLFYFKVGKKTAQKGKKTALKYARDQIPFLAELHEATFSWEHRASWGYSECYSPGASMWARRGETGLLTKSCL